MIAAIANWTPEQWVAVLGAVAAFLTTLAGFVVSIRKVNQVHVLVNQRMTDVQARVRQLTDALEQGDGTVPDDPAADPAAPGYHKGATG